MRVLPFLVFDVVPPNDPGLLLIIEANQITEMVFAPKIPKSDLPYLHDLILSVTHEFKRLFPELSIINKMHHFLHYVSAIAKMGPMCHLSTFKYEAQHQLFKKLGAICCNYKYIESSLCNFGQINETFIWGSGKNPIRKRLTLPARSEAEELDEEIVRLFLQKDILPCEVTKYDWIQIYSTKFYENSIVAYESGRENMKNMPLFGEILRMFVVGESKVLFYCRDYETLYLEESLNSYRISELSYYRLVIFEDLCDRKPLFIWKDYTGSDYKYICLRHMLL